MFYKRVLSLVGLKLWRLLSNLDMVAQTGSIQTFRQIILICSCYNFVYFHCRGRGEGCFSIHCPLSYLLKFPKYLGQRMRERVNKTLGTSIIYCPVPDDLRIGPQFILLIIPYYILKRGDTFSTSLQYYFHQQ